MWMCTLDGEKFDTQEEALDDFYEYSNDEIFEEMEKSLSYQELVEMVLNLRGSFHASADRRTVDNFINKIAEEFEEAGAAVFADQYVEIEDEDEDEEDDEDEMC